MLDISTIAYQLPIEVDCTKLLNEIDNLVLPYYDKDIKNNLASTKGVNISITGTASNSLDNWYNSAYNRPMTTLRDRDTGEEFVKTLQNFKKFTLGFPGGWRNNMESLYDDGVSDEDLIHWHPTLIGSEIYNLKNRIADFLKIDNQLRCRASFLHSGTQMNFHTDPHTPWRVHVNLKSGDKTSWLFRTVNPTEIIEWVQPKNSVWLIRTGDVQHSVRVAEGETRWQLFYHIRQTNLGPNYHQIA